MGSPTSNPNVTIQLLPAAIVDAFESRKDLIVGQTGTTGNAVSNQLYQNVHSLSDLEVRTLFGTSHLYHSIQFWKSANGSYSPLDVISVDAAGGATEAESTISFTGTATADGTYSVFIVDEELFPITLSVSSGDTAATVATALETAVAALDRPVFSANAVSGDVTFTASDAGTIGNVYGLKVDGVVSGLANSNVTWGGGATDPTVTTIVDPIQGTRYTSVLWPENWSSVRSIMVDEFDTRFNASNGIMDGEVFNGFNATLADAKTEVSTENSQSLVVGGQNVGSFGPSIMQPADWSMAYFMGVESRRLTPGAPVADFIVATNGQLDAIGGPANASLPIFNTPLNLMPVTSPANLYDETGQRELEVAGFTTWGVNIAGNEMIMGPVVTTWTTDASGNPNVSFHYLNYVRTGSVCREIFFRTLRSTYAQTRLTDGDLIAQRSITNEESIKAELLRIYRVLSGIALVQSGREAEKFFSDNTTVSVELATGTVTVAGPLPIVTQLRAINYALQFSFSLEETGTVITF